MATMTQNFSIIIISNNTGVMSFFSSSIYVSTVIKNTPASCCSFTACKVIPVNSPFRFQITSDLGHDGEVVVRLQPHGAVGLGSLPLQQLPQQPLHLAVSGVCTLHRLLCVETVKMAQLQYWGKKGRERGERKKGQIPDLSVTKATMWNLGKLQTCLPGVKQPSCDQSPDQKEPCNEPRRAVFVNWTAWRIWSFTPRLDQTSLIWWKQ